MPIIKDGKFIDDDWILLDDEGEVPSSGNVILPLTKAQQQVATLNEHQGLIGLSIPNDVEVETIKGLISSVDMILLHLPSFADGRAYSQARYLREMLGFTGELRLKGDVLVDQAAYLLRCGFDSFDCDNEIDLTLWKNSIGAVTLSYQTGYRDSLAKRTNS